MEQYLNSYINRMRSHVTGLAPTTAHEIASAFLAFRFRLYANAIQECTRAISLIPDKGCNDALKKALAIVRAHAENLENSQFTTNIPYAFSDEDRPCLPVDLPQDRIEDTGTFQLDNALVLIYTIAIITSPDDEETLTEHRKFIVRLLMGYKKALGLE